MNGQASIDLSIQDNRLHPQWASWKSGASELSLSHPIPSISMFGRLRSKRLPYLLPIS